MSCRFVLFLVFAGNSPPQFEEAAPSDETRWLFLAPLFLAGCGANTSSGDRSEAPPPMPAPAKAPANASTGSAGNLDALIDRTIQAAGSPDYCVQIDTGELWLQVVSNAINVQYPRQQDPTDLGRTLGLTSELLSWDADLFATWSSEGMKPDQIRPFLERYVAHITGKPANSAAWSVSLDTL